MDGKKAGMGQKAQFLGVILDQKLTMNDQMQHVTETAFGKLRIVKY